MTLALSIDPHLLGTFHLQKAAYEMCQTMSNCCRYQSVKRCAARTPKGVGILKQQLNINLHFWHRMQIMHVTATVHAQTLWRVWYLLTYLLTFKPAHILLHQWQVQQHSMAFSQTERCPATDIIVSCFLICNWCLQSSSHCVDTNTYYENNHHLSELKTWL